MYCKNCGKNLSEGTIQCPFCGQSISAPIVPQQIYASPTEIKNHMVEAILVTLFCCLPFGIIAIVNASKVSSLVAAGDYQAATEASNNASKWVKISLVVGIIINIIAFVAEFASALANS